MIRGHWGPLFRSSEHHGRWGVGAAPFRAKQVAQWQVQHRGVYTKGYSPSAERRGSLRQTQHDPFLDES